MRIPISLPCPTVSAVCEFFTNDETEGIKGPVKIYAQIYLQAPAEWSQPAIETSSRAASKCFMFMYFLLPH